MTTWYPDTCGCELLISDLSSDRGTVTNLVTACSWHSSWTHITVSDENRFKNYVTADITASSSLYVFNWSYDKTRLLIMTFDPAGAPSSAALIGLQNAMDAKYGAGKVLLV